MRMSLALKATKVGQLLDNFRQRLASASRSPKSWQGMAMFVEHQLRHDDPARQTAREYFRRNLDDILHVARKAQVPVIVSTLGSNLKDCAPFASCRKITRLESSHT